MSNAKTNSNVIQGPPKNPFGMSKFSKQKFTQAPVRGAGFTPKTKVVLPPVRITQNKGGGGK